MNYATKVEIPESKVKFGYKDELMLLGSCFADEIGKKMVEYRFRACVNPFGELYNPLSVAAACRRLMSPVPFAIEDLVFYNGLYHSFMHHGRFSNVSQEACLSMINDSLADSAKRFPNLEFLMITFGTAYIYRLKKNGQVVANCHKLPASDFSRNILTVNEIVEVYEDLLNEIRRVNRSMKIVFTVSPIRHLSDGAHGNLVSKSTLILAVQALVEKYPSQVFYFPAYELMMDELRDYRFYAADMLHPSPVAVEYIWDRFCETYLSASDKSILKEVLDINKALNHNSLNGNTDVYKQFLMQTMLKIKRLREKNPYICFPEEEKRITNSML
ncbi:MAG: GSCFA domain-containing protein [Tannerella sp.]|nr:GSCFA domain-containing protein [Tannerella sp.]